MKEIPKYHEHDVLVDDVVVGKTYKQDGEWWGASGSYVKGPFLERLDAENHLKRRFIAKKKADK